MNRRHRLNYIYFGALFVVLAALHIFHVMLLEQGSGLSRVCYITSALGQCLVEVALLVLGGAWVAEKCPYFFKGLFVVSTFLVFLLHLLDFPLVRIMDMSIWYVFSFIFAESFENFVEMLKASHIQLVTWVWMGVGAFILLWAGIVLFRLADRFSTRRPVFFSYGGATFFVITAVSTLALFDYQAAFFARSHEEGKFLKALPWKTTLFTAAYPLWQINACLAPALSEQASLAQLSTLDVTPQAKPNIYLFIAESIREDFITSETAPTLSQFRLQEISFPCAVSAANATHPSWFSIFHSVYPFSWEQRQPKTWSRGSLPLQIFKKAGYQIHVFSASQLSFYQMDKMLFGTDHALVDELRIFAQEGVIKSHVYDGKCIDALLEKMPSAEQGHLFIIFFEGTHFDYSWPSHLVLPKRPVAKAIDYLKVTYSKKDLEGIKNRYRHAIYHIDQQFSRFLEALKLHPKQQEAVVVFTSDHGEEFFEEGRIFHASNLNRAQTRVPLYLRLPGQKSLCSLMSHLDIFPTLLDHVLGSVPLGFEGESILRAKDKQFAITARFNASHNPFEFLITTPEESLVVRFDKRDDIQHAHALEIVSRKNKEESLIPSSLTELQHAYQPIIEHLFPNRIEYRP